MKKFILTETKWIWLNIRIQARIIAALPTSRDIAPRPFQVKWMQDLPKAANQGSSLLLKNTTTYTWGWHWWLNMDSKFTCCTSKQFLISKRHQMQQKNYNMIAIKRSKETWIMRWRIGKRVLEETQRKDHSIKVM